MPTEVNLQTFEDALARLDEALSERAADPENTFLRDAVILRFTFTFEPAISTLRRYLEEVAALRSANRMSPRRCLREAADLGLIAECADWMLHAEHRNRFHGEYDERIVDAMAANATAFAADARALLNAMEQGIADGG
jgi:nucleotidyltransferase substrate binding protein (TIGR01987 family)